VGDGQYIHDSVKTENFWSTTIYLLCVWWRSCRREVFNV